MDGSLTIQVRSPSMSETLTLTTERNASVRSLKRLIHTVHPKKPSINDQRIIFGGKLLSDADTLNRILEKTDVDSIPTFHLVVKPTPVAATTNSTTTATSASSSSTASPFNHRNIYNNNLNTQAVPPRPSAPPQTAPSEQPQRTATTTSTFPPSQQQQQQQQHQGMPGYPPLLPGGYQVIALNGQYYLAPVLVPAFAPQQASLSPASQQQAFQFYTSTPLSNHPHPHQQQQQQQQFQYQQASQPVPQQQQQQQQQPGGIRPPVFVHAQNQVQRATSVWLALKLIFILFILCQDASLERILFFHVVAFIFFLYQTGRLRFVIQRVRLEDLNRPQQQQQQQQQPQPVHAGAAAPPQHQHPPAPPSAESAPSTPQPGTEQQQPQVQQGQNAQGSSASSGSSNAPTQNQQQQQQQPATLLATLKRGAYTFVASLWPNYGHDARIAQALDNGQNDAWEGF